MLPSPPYGWRHDSSLSPVFTLWGTNQSECYLMTKEKRICRGCGKSFEKSKTKRGLVSYCSDTCCTLTYYRNNPHKRLRDQWSKRVDEMECCVCGFNRTLDKCHVVWRKDGGKVTKDNIVILCPNHHRLMDSNRLTTKEKKLLKTVGGRSLT